MKKKLVTLFLATGLAAGLSGCGDQTTPEPEMAPDERSRVAPPADAGQGTEVALAALPQRDREVRGGANAS